MSSRLDISCLAGFVFCSAFSAGWRRLRAFRGNIVEPIPSHWNVATSNELSFTSIDLEKRCFEMTKSKPSIDNAKTYRKTSTVRLMN